MIDVEDMRKRLADDALSVQDVDAIIDALEQAQDAITEVKRRCQIRVDENPYHHGPDTTWMTVADVLLALERRGPI